MRSWLFALLLVLSIGGCGSPGPQVGTNTNWMKSCDRDAECGGENACLCGRCTTMCSEPDESCGEGAMCSPSDAAQLQCAGEETRTCQPECSESSECQVGRLCHRGVCVDPFNVDSCPEGSLFCEDFDDDELDYTQVVTDNNSLSRIDTPSPSGESALQVHIGDGPSVAFMRAALPALNSGELFLSGWVRVPQQEAHDVAPLAFWTSEDEGWALRLVIKDAKLQLWSDTTPLTSSIQLQAGEWHCLQLDVEIAEASEGSATLKVDGSVVGAATEIDTLPAGGIEAVAIGSLWSGVPADLLIDRVVVSRAAIGCFE